VVNNFLVLFNEKEGTSAIVRLLANCPGVAVLHQVDDRGWEPFDRHNCGSMPRADLRRCLELAWGDQPVDMEELNRIYLRSAPRPLDPISSPSAAGFKMRFRPPARDAPAMRWALRFVRPAARARYVGWPFRRMMFELLRELDVVTFIAVRQDVLRWALSRYHGDGSGQRGHLQFRLAAGEIRRDEIPTMNVDCERLGTEIERCERHHRKKAVLMAELRRRGIRAYPLLYESFLREPVPFFERVLQRLDVSHSRDVIAAALERGTSFEKVHSDEISQYVTNHEEVRERFEGRYVSWEDDVGSRPGGSRS
jgi:hypothetical protein